MISQALYVSFNKKIFRSNLSNKIQVKFKQFPFIYCHFIDNEQLLAGKPQNIRPVTIVLPQVFMQHSNYSIYIAFLFLHAYKYTLILNTLAFPLYVFTVYPVKQIAQLAE